jgi:hypothetical protein
MRFEHKRFCLQHLSCDGFPAMLAAAPRCTALRRLNLAQNYLSDSERLRLQDAWGLEREGLALLNK